MRTIETKVYQYEELSDKAKATARQWYTSDWDCFHSDTVIEDAVTIAALMGLTIDTRPVKTMGGNTTHQACIYWSGFCQQGDGACFEGTYKYKADSIEAVKGYLEDAEINRIALVLHELQRQHGNALVARITHRGNYTYAESMDVTVECELMEVDADVQEAVKELMIDFANWIYKSLEAEYNYQTSDENVADTIMANEYEFTEDGKRAG